MDPYLLLTRLGLCLVVLYGVSVPIVLALCMVEQRRMTRDDRLRRSGRS